MPDWARMPGALYIGLSAMLWTMGAALGSTMLRALPERVALSTHYFLMGADITML